MKDQDRRAVEGMARCGIDLEGLIAMFPSFSADEVTEVHREINKDFMKWAREYEVSHLCVRGGDANAGK